MNRMNMKARVPKADLGCSLRQFEEDEVEFKEARNGSPECGGLAAVARQDSGSRDAW